jgi:hypothetical protein
LLLRRSTHELRRARKHLPALTSRESNAGRDERIMRSVETTLPARFRHSLSGRPGQALAAAAIMARMMMVITNCMVVMASASKLPRHPQNFKMPGEAAAYRLHIIVKTSLPKPSCVGWAAKR